MVTSSNINKLRNGEIVAFFDNLESILAEADLETLKLASFTVPVSAGYAEIKKLYKEERGSKITRELIEWDQKRDQYFVALRNILYQHMQDHPVAEKRKKAGLVHDILTKFGQELHSKSYQEQTAGLGSIIETVDADTEATEALASLYLTVYYEAVKEANSHFDEAYLSRNKEYAESPKEKFKEVRDRTEKAFHRLATKINAFVELAEDPAPYVQLGDKVSSLVETYQQTVERRLSLNGVEDEEALNADFREIVE